MLILWAHLTIYARLIPELAVIDFDTKNLDGHPLWELCCQRGYLMCETVKGYHVYVRCNIQYRSVFTKVPITRYGTQRAVHSSGY